MISIKGKDKAAVLAALYNRAQPLGRGFEHYDPTPMTVEDAKAVLGDLDWGNLFPRRGQFQFDYLKGRVMKVNIESDEFNESLYDRDNGPGAAAEAIKDL